MTDGMTTVEITPAGPRLYVSDVLVRCGSVGDEMWFVHLAERIAERLTERDKTCLQDGHAFAEARIAYLEEQLAAAEAERGRLDALINTPLTADFLAAVRTEAAHQVDRWGPAHDRGKSAENWYWLVGYLAGKALRSAIEGDQEKALHHTISSAAALLHWHTAISQDPTTRGRGDDRDLEEIARFEEGAAPACSV